jgi:hypothetical protein
MGGRDAGNGREASRFGGVGLYCGSDVKVYEFKSNINVFPTREDGTPAKFPKEPR